MTILLQSDPRTAGFRVPGRIIQGLLHDPVECRLDGGGESAYSLSFDGHLKLRRTDYMPTHHPRRRSEEHTSELQSQSNLVCRLLLEKKKKHNKPKKYDTLRSNIRS